MGLFRELGRQVEEFKARATAAEKRAEAQCDECGARFSDEREQCPDCGSEPVESDRRRE